MKKIFLISLVIVFSLFSFSKANAQANEIVNLCTKHMIAPFISDGQQYRSLLNGDEIAEFHTTFYGDNTYRIIACSGLTEGKLLFSVYDKERNLLFTNKDYDNSPYWDLKFTSTINCIIEAELDKNNVSSGFALLMIGFKQN